MHRKDYNRYYLSKKCVCGKHIMPAWKYCSEECSKKAIKKRLKLYIKKKKL